MLKLLVAVRLQALVAVLRPQVLVLAPPPLVVLGVQIPAALVILLQRAVLVVVARIPAPPIPPLQPARLALPKALLLGVSLKRVVAHLKTLVPKLAVLLVRLTAAHQGAKQVVLVVNLVILRNHLQV